MAFIALATLAATGLFACSGSARNDAIPTVAPTALLLPTLSSGTSTREPAPPATVRPTATLLPTITPRPTPCPPSVQSALLDAWSREELGCPITPGRRGINTAYAPFEGGQMLWRDDTGVIYVLFNDGTWDSYPNEWQEGDPIYSCGEANSPPTPVRGFGRVWCEHPGVRDALGAVTAAEIGDNASAAQDFVNGAILAAPFGDLFVFVGEDGVWRRVDD